MQDLDKIPQWKIKLGQSSPTSDTANTDSTTKNDSSNSKGGIPWIPIILGSLLAIGIFSTFQKKKDDVKN